jgi:hypothetical protein
MGYLVRDDEASRCDRRQDEPPVETDALIRRAAAPPGPCIADGNRARRCARSSRVVRGFAGQCLQGALLQESFNPPGESRLRSAAYYLALLKCGCAGCVRYPNEADVLSLEGDYRSWL